MTQHSRRGLDKVGTVIITAWNDVPPESTLRTLLTGTASLLTSQFRLTYAMILSLLRVSDLSVEDMIKRSFSEFHAQRALQQQNLSAQLRQLESHLESLCLDNISEQSRDFFTSYRQLRGVSGALFRMIFNRGWANRLQSVFSKGRIVWIHSTLLSSPCLAIVLPEVVEQEKPCIVPDGTSELALANARLREEHLKTAFTPAPNQTAVAQDLRVLIILPEENSDSPVEYTDDTIPSAGTCEGLLDGKHFKIMKAPYSNVLCAIEEKFGVDGAISHALERLEELRKLPQNVIDIAKSMQLADFEAQNYSQVIKTKGMLLLGPTLISTDQKEFSLLWEAEELKTKVITVLNFLLQISSHS